MRAALAPVIGLIGALVGMSATAVELGYTATPGDLAPDKNPPARYASETLSETGCFLVGRTCAGYRIVATETQMTITSTADILLPAGTQYYVRYNFDGAIFGRALVDEDLQVNNGGDATDQPAEAVAYRGAVAGNSVIFQLSGSTGLDKDSVFTLELSGATVEDDEGTPAVDESDAKFADIYVTRAGSITASISVHASLTGAVDGTGALYSASGRIASIDNAVSGKITSHADTANVSTSVDDGGPFRRFVPTGMGGEISGVLATVVTRVTVGSELSTAARGWQRGRRNAMTGFDVDASIVSALDVTATSEAGNFAVATKNGGAIVPDKNEPANNNSKVTNRTPWMLASKADCGTGPLTLGVVGGTIETYKSRDCPAGSAADCTGDPDGATGDDAGPLKGSDLTPAGIASANIAANDNVTGNAVGTNYFCVLVNGNTDPIPEIGDPDMPGEYTLTVTPVLADADNRPYPSGAIGAGATAVGAIDRNGTTVHVPYLSTHMAYNQRLVLVNRGADSALFWIEDDSFNLEEGTMLMKNNLSPDNARTIPGDGRLVIRVQDNIGFNDDGMTRGAATVNVAAPTRDIDVMTIQVHPGTGQIDTTVYQHAE
jgi:hypothetical protein